MTLHRVLQIYIDKADYFQRFIAKGLDLQIAEDLYQEFYLYLSRPVILNKITPQDGEGRIVQFIKGCFKWFKMEYFRDKIFGPNHTGASGWIDIKTPLKESDSSNPDTLEETLSVEYLPYEEFENDTDMKVLVLKLKEKFPGFTGLARMVDKSLAGEDIFTRENKAKNHALIKHLKMNHVDKLIDFKDKYGEGYL